MARSVGGCRPYSSANDRACRSGNYRPTQASGRRAFRRRISAGRQHENDAAAESRCHQSHQIILSARPIALLFEKVLEGIKVPRRGRKSSYFITNNLYYGIHSLIQFCTCHYC